MSDKNTIVFDHVEKTYQKNTVIRDLNLTIPAGQRLILLGPSGCGKSTTLRMIAGLEEITGGELRMGGRRVNEVPSGKRDIAMVFQNYALYPHMTVRENITYALRVHKLDRAELETRLHSVLEILGLEPYVQRKPRELSGGQRQRVALARALVKQSRYLLLDEPLSNLDAQLRVQARKELVKIHDLYQQTFVYVTHDQVEAMTVGQRVALMNQGVLQMVDTPYRVYNRPANIFTAKFIGSPSTNILDADWADGVLHVQGQQIRLPDCWSWLAERSGEHELCLGIRPEHIRLQAGRAENGLTGTLRYVEDYGNKRGIYVDVGGTEVVCMCDRVPCAPGETVSFQLDSDHLHLFSRTTTNSLGYPDEVTESDDAQWDSREELLSYGTSA
ncbi:ABC transporter ATP-binding protein [Dysosmobacter sp.]|uniref:ABC transporter ATP-binding protein n=1 Tax=Dysosmobacter sp. TaxID=2591382 RepID=UPI00261867A2|nr:ABC transporter ATP-binding protein [Dysosmobacter sp.]